MRILFIGNTRLGDAILSTSILRYYFENKADITIVCSPVSRGIYEGYTTKEKLIIIKKQKFSFHWVEVYKKLDSIKWNIVVDLRNTILSRIIRKKKILRLKSVTKSTKHRIEDLCELIKLDDIKSPKIIVKRKDILETEIFMKKMNIKKPVLAIAPFTNWSRKNWPVEKYILVIENLLLNKKIKKIKSIILLGSKNERALCENMLKKLNHNSIQNLAGELKISHLYYLIKNCEMFVGNDSGLAHLSAAAGIKTLALFGPSREIHYRPWGENSFFIRTPESYEDLVLKKGYDRHKKSSLLKNLDENKVIKFCEKILKK